MSRACAAAIDYEIRAVAIRLVGVPFLLHAHVMQVSEVRLVCEVCKRHPTIFG